MNAEILCRIEAQWKVYTLIEDVFNDFDTNQSVT